MNTEEIYKVLVSLGYDLFDRGSYWQTNAVFRNGDNKTALQIYKDTGVWRDFVNNTPPARFESLIVKTLGTNDKKILEKYIKGGKISSLPNSRRPQSEKLTMEEIFPETILKKLLPHYDFYNQKEISSDTLKRLKGGLATQGQMYQRFVFPIFNQDGQIHGFSGRDMSSKEGRPKWKHIGRKSGWVYPAYVPEFNPLFIEAVEKSGSVIIAESIGDLLSLHENGILNALVAFGVDLGPALISFLLQINPRKIVLSFNNDCDKPENRGLNGAVKNYLKLLSHFDYYKIGICLPPSGDFGDMKKEEFTKWKCKLKEQSLEENARVILKFAKKLANTKALSKRLIKNMNSLSSSLNE